MNYLSLSNRYWKPIVRMAFILLFSLNINAQNMVVIGTVSNDQNQKIVGAEVKLGQQNSKTNSKGAFSFKLTKFPAQLTIKHALYKEYIDVVRVPLLNQKDTIFLDVILENNVTELEEVTVNSSRVIWAYQKPHTHIIDFALMDDEILLLCSENHQYFLRRLDSLSQKMTDLPIKKNPQNLYEDCTGEIHLVYTDSLFELKLFGKSTILSTGYPYVQAMEILSPCVISNANNFIVKALGPHKKLVKYTTIDRNTKQTELLYITSDREQMRGLDDYAKANDIPVPLANPNYKYSPPIASGLTDRQKWQNQQFYRQILSKELYTPIFEINDSLVIFDHFTDSALVFKPNGDFVRSFQISYHYFENWKNELIVNEEKTKIYAKYETDGLVTLREIDPSTGKVLNTTLLEKHIHPLSIQIRNNNAFYIYKHYLDDSIHYLYKQALKH